jgi:hypothetical protein
VRSFTRSLAGCGFGSVLALCPEVLGIVCAKGDEFRKYGGNPYGYSNLRSSLG